MSDEQYIPGLEVCEASFTEVQMLNPDSIEINGRQIFEIGNFLGK